MPLVKVRYLSREECASLESFMRILNSCCYSYSLFLIIDFVQLVYIVKYLFTRSEVTWKVQKMRLTGQIDGIICASSWNEAVHLLIQTLNQAQRSELLV